MPTPFAALSSMSNTPAAAVAGEWPYKISAILAALLVLWTAAV